MNNEGVGRLMEYIGECLFGHLMVFQIFFFFLVTTLISGLPIITLFSQFAAFVTT